MCNRGLLRGVVQRSSEGRAQRGARNGEEGMLCASGVGAYMRKRQFGGAAQRGRQAARCAAEEEGKQVQKGYVQEASDCIGGCRAYVFKRQSQAGREGRQGRGSGGQCSRSRGGCVCMQHSVVFFFVSAGDILHPPTIHA